MAFFKPRAGLVQNLDQGAMGMPEGQIKWFHRTEREKGYFCPLRSDSGRWIWILEGRPEGNLRNRRDTESPASQDRPGIWQYYKFRIFPLVVAFFFG